MLLKWAIIMIRMMDGRPIKGVLEAYNAYELLLDLGQGKKLIVFKGAVSSIEYEDKPASMKESTFTVLDDEDLEFADILRCLGMQRNVAILITYLASVGEATSK
jgi:sRNA-binding regulator protein Hfq